MAKKTIAQLREQEIDHLVSFKTYTPTEEDYAEARRIMNSFYRLCGLSETNLYLANDERTANTPYRHRSEEREYNWFVRLNKQFNEIYGLSLFYSGYAPSIGIKYPGGGCAEKITRWFY